MTIMNNSGSVTSNVVLFVVNYINVTNNVINVMVRCHGLCLSLMSRFLLWFNVMFQCHSLCYGLMPWLNIMVYVMI